MLARQLVFELGPELLPVELKLDATPLLAETALMTGMFSRSKMLIFELLAGGTFKLVLLEFEGTLRLVLLEFALLIPLCFALCSRLLDRDETGEVLRGGRSVRSGYPYANGPQFAAAAAGGLLRDGTGVDPGRGPRAPFAGAFDFSFADFNECSEEVIDTVSSCCCSAPSASGEPITITSSEEEGNVDRLKVLLLLFPKLNFHFDGFFTIAGEIVAVGEGAGGATAETGTDVCTGGGLGLEGDDKDEAEEASTEVNDGTLLEISEPDGVLNTGNDGGRPVDD